LFRRARSPLARFRIFFFFLFFEKIRRRLKLFFLSLLEGRKSTGKGTLFYFCRKTHLFPARGGCSGEGSETIKRAKKDFPRCLFPGSSGVWMRIALKPLERLDVLRALDGIAAWGAIFSLSFSVLDMGEDILFWWAVTRIRRRNLFSRVFFSRDAH